MHATVKICMEVDESYINARNKLPITKLVFGDVNDKHEHIYHVLGIE